jgi:hypothetical protein
MSELYERGIFSVTPNQTKIISLGEERLGGREPHK